MLPKVVILFSGKRKSGKDYVTDQLQEILGENDCTIIKISQPIKSHWAKSKNLDLDQLLGDGEYKERHRLDMIRWSEEMREKDYGYFCRIACENARPARVWVVSDIRRRTDLKWFRENYGPKLKTVKVVANQNVRVQRGWIFSPGVDDAPSECDLDSVKDWDLLIDNNSTADSADKKLTSILDFIKTCV